MRMSSSPVYTKRGKRAVFLVALACWYIFIWCWCWSLQWLNEICKAAYPVVKHGERERGREGGREGGRESIDLVDMATVILCRCWQNGQLLNNETGLLIKLFSLFMRGNTEVKFSGPFPTADLYVVKHGISWRRRSYREQANIDLHVFPLSQIIVRLQLCTFLLLNDS